jgi:hypothetical protein
MARIRTIKPEFYTDETLGECSPTARLLFIGIWSHADDYGNLDRSARQLRAQVFPYDNFDCEELIQELLSRELLIEYEFNSKKFLHVPGFAEHQKIEKPSKPRFPGYEESRRTPRILPDSSPPSSGSSLGREGKVRERDLRDRTVEFGSSTDLEGPDAVLQNADDSDPPPELNLEGNPPSPPNLARLERHRTAERIFEHWQKTHQHPRAKLDDKRRRKILGALDLGYSEADLCQCITGYLNSPHHTGQNDRDTAYDDVELMLRDAKHVDAGLKFYHQPPRTDLSAQTRRIIDQTEDWQPPETRNATR